MATEWGKKSKNSLSDIHTLLFCRSIKTHPNGRWYTVTKTYIQPKNNTHPSSEHNSMNTSRHFRTSMPFAHQLGADEMNLTVESIWFKNGRKKFSSPAWWGGRCMNGVGCCFFGHHGFCGTFNLFVLCSVFCVLCFRASGPIMCEYGSAFLRHLVILSSCCYVKVFVLSRITTYDGELIDIISRLVLYHHVLFYFFFSKNNKSLHVVHIFKPLLSYTSEPAWSVWCLSPKHCHSTQWQSRPFYKPLHHSRTHAHPNPNESSYGI